ncbi:integrase core domain-containing protein [Streptomyces sp. NPDC051956]|uniref:integrase core domain-containing protein n=1 Tax=Streptomyces sp. NPDC051956 TaxID=3365677 RepID=UPI0037D5BDB2
MGTGYWTMCCPTPMPFLAADFLHLDCAFTLKRHYAPIFIEHGTRRVHLARVTTHSTGQWTVQQTRNPAMALDRRMDSLRFLLRDQDSKYSASIDTAFEAHDVKTLLSPPRAPKVNAICERAMGTLHRELLDRTLIYNRAHAVKVLTEYTQHRNRHRPHQSRQQLPPDSTESPAPATAADLQAHKIRRRSTLGGLIKEYQRAA